MNKKCDKIKIKLGINQESTFISLSNYLSHLTRVRMVFIKQHLKNSE